MFAYTHVKPYYQMDEIKAEKDIDHAELTFFYMVSYSNHLTIILRANKTLLI
jgi:hypothetical protein